MNLEQNKQDRLEAEEIFEAFLKDKRQRFYEVMIKLCNEKLPKVEEPIDDFDPMDFEKEIITFGKYFGQAVHEVPLDYLIFLTENEFNKKLNKYVRSKRFKELQDKE